MKSNSKKIIFAIEILLILVLLAVLAFFMFGLNDAQIAELDTEKLGINEEVYNKNPSDGSSMNLESEGIPETGYMNIALFGVDATSRGSDVAQSLAKNNRSDCIMIASVNVDTGDVKLVSVYRDTYLNLGTDKYNKCNGAYFSGGYEQAIKMLNMNLDLDITNFITVNYIGLIDLIDGLGGIYVDVDSNELRHINNYQITINNDFKLGGYTPVKETGYQRLNGLQATAYCRIRYDIPGGDFGRASNQREVIKAIEEQAKKTDAVTLTRVFNNVLPEVLTSMDSEDLLQLVTNINSYRIVDEGGFPEESMRATGNIGAKGSCVIPKNLEKNVSWLHKFLFGEENYVPSAIVRECSEQITADTAAYVGR